MYTNSRKVYKLQTQFWALLKVLKANHSKGFRD